MADDKVQVPDEELTIEFDAFVDSVSKWNHEDSERAQSAGLTRQEIGAFIDKTGVNSKALSHARQVTKMKKEADQRDYIRSMEELLGFLKTRLDGNGTADMLDGAA